MSDATMMPSAAAEVADDRCSACRVWAGVIVLLVADGVAGRIFASVVKEYTLNDAPRYLCSSAATQGFASVISDLAVHWLPRVGILGLITVLMVRFAGLDWRDGLLRWHLPRLGACALVGTALVLYHMGVRWAAGGLPVACAKGLSLSPFRFCGLYALRFLPSAAAEEVVYRGGLITLLRARYGLTCAAAVSLVFFGMGHAYGGSWLMVNSVLLGIAFTIAYLQTRSLLPGLLAHAFSNVVHASLNY